ncbi:MAG TPA: hypothetical protein VIY72_09825 [Acidimicrobiales bacterium]
MSDPESAPPPASPSVSRPAPQTALPSVGARVLAFAAIVLAGAAGAFIGYAFADLQTDSTVAVGLSALIGAVVAAGGTAVVVVLTLRAMTEWRTIQTDAPTQSGRTPDGGTRRPPRVR